MTDDLDFQESLDRYFEIEAAELLQTIEETLIVLVEEKTIERVHTLMRAAHTIKGSAANCGFKTIETIAHHLEDVFQALYPPELEIDPQLGSLLMEGYDCLYDPLSALLAGVPYDEAATLERTAELFARLQTHLGDFFGRETPLPTAAELGFDVIGSIFTDSIPHDLEDLSVAIASQNAGKVSESLRSLAEFLLELGGSYSLPGIAEIAIATITALERHPARVLELAPIVLTNFQQAQIAIIGGDRSVGGEVSSALAAWSHSAPGLATDRSVTPADSSEWLSLIDDPNSEHPSPASSISTDTTADHTDSLDWLSLVDHQEIAAPELVDLSTTPTSDWLSLVEDETTTAGATFTEITASTETDQAEWLSLVDDSTTTAAAPLTDRNSAETDQTEWLSLVDDSTTTAAAPLTDSNSTESEWLSLVDSPDLVITSDDSHSEMVEIGSFEPDSDDFSVDLSQTEYVIEASEAPSKSELALSNRSGLDRIFQSIWSGNAESTSTEEPPEVTKPAEPREAQADALVSVRVATIQLERLSHTIGELLIDDNQQYLRAEQLQKLAQSTVEQYRRCEQKLRIVSDWADKSNLANERLKSSTRQSPSSAKDRRKQRKKTTNNEIQSQFDSLEMDVYSDLSILIQNLTDELAELGIKVSNLADITQKSRITLSKRQQLLAEAQSELFEARMVEISGVLNRFPRLLQQMIAAHRKPAQLQLIGSEVSIDKTIAEKLYDPLLHLVRNAYDHGIESSESRIAQGKSPTGQLTIKVYHQGNRTKIEVSDDGQGLNFVKIRQRAIDMHLLDAHHPATEAELSEIMFSPGFSTAEQVNDLSGRGIGLDVVRDRLSTLQGKIDVRSIAGKGTTFVMQFPLNLTTTRLLICESEGLVHALRSEAISQVLLPDPDRIQSQSLFTDRTARFLRWGEDTAQKLIPIYPVASLLDYHCATFANDERVMNLFPVKTKNNTNALLLLDLDGEQICLEVNRILVEQELVVKSLGQTFGLPSYVQGYSVLGDGSLTLALDPVELLTRVRSNSSNSFIPANLPALSPVARPALAPARDSVPAEVGEILDQIVSRNSVQPGRQLQVLVVDDSLVQRQSLVRSLTKAGCQVIQASHGREGILRLQEHPRIRLVVCDIEMPQMNGFEFLSHCRQDPKLAQIPIVMLTTRGGQKHRQLAMTLGAKDYLTKPQSEHDLLEIVAKLAQPIEVGV
jgi:two-component system, chemotaxis family, sensor histidine kinase and response regulator PixL